MEVAHLSRSNSTSSTRKSLVSTSLWICCRSSSSFCRSSLDLSLSAAHDSRRTEWSAFLLRELKVVWDDAQTVLLNTTLELGGRQPDVRLGVPASLLEVKNAIYSMSVSLIYIMKMNHQCWHINCSLSRLVCINWMTEKLVPILCMSGISLDKRSRSFGVTSTDHQSRFNLH